MIHHDVKQNSERWHELRLGIPTASEFHRIITPKTMKLSSQAEGYRDWLLAEWIYGAPLESPETSFMQRGSDLEPEAVRSYEFERDCEVQEAGFFTSDDGMVGASPDRLVGSCGLLEIKCPAPQTHVGYMMSRAVDEKYMTQLQGQLWVCERDSVDIQSYCPGLPTVIINVGRDEKYIAALSAAVRMFVDSLLASRMKLTQEYGDFRQRKPPAPVDELGVSDDDLEVILQGRKEAQPVDTQ